MRIPPLSRRRRPSGRPPTSRVHGRGDFPSHESLALPQSCVLSIVCSFVFIEDEAGAWDIPAMGNHVPAILMIGAAFAALPMAQGADRPVAVAGYSTGKYLVETLLPKAGLTAEGLIDTPPPVAAYKNYSAVIWNDLIKDPQLFGEEVFWDLGSNPSDLAEYVQAGGIIIVAGVGIPVSNFKLVRKLGVEVADVLGISGVALGRPQGAVRITEPSDPLFAGLQTGRESYEWVGETSAAAAGSTTGKVLAVVSTESGQELPFITVNEVGRGKAYWMGTAPARVPKTGGSGEDRAAYERVLLNALQAPNP